MWTRAGLEYAITQHKVSNKDDCDKNTKQFNIFHFNTMQTWKCYKLADVHKRFSILIFFLLCFRWRMLTWMCGLRLLWFLNMEIWKSKKFNSYTYIYTFKLNKQMNTINDQTNKQTNKQTGKEFFFNISLVWTTQLVN